MNIESATMTVDRAVAREHYRAYRDAVRSKRATRDDAMLYRAYRALVRGQKIIDLQRAIGDAGCYDSGLPKLAVSRADRPMVFCRSYVAQVTFSASEYTFGRRPRGEVSIPAKYFPQRRQMTDGRAAVPTIPPQYRPPAHQLVEHHILWEAEWLPRPVGDPMLLKHVDGPFYVVLAAWDLSPLEQAVMRQRL